jgi:hypothetical protein
MRGTQPPPQPEAGATCAKSQSPKRRSTGRGKPRPRDASAPQSRPEQAGLPGSLGRSSSSRSAVASGAPERSGRVLSRPAGIVVGCGEGCQRAELPTPAGGRDERHGARGGRGVVTGVVRPPRRLHKGGWCAGRKRAARVVRACLTPALAGAARAAMPTPRAGRLPRGAGLAPPGTLRHWGRWTRRQRLGVSHAPSDFAAADRRCALSDQPRARRRSLS